MVEIEAAPHCANCGRQVHEDWIICPTCRNRLQAAYAPIARVWSSSTGRCAPGAARTSSDLICSRRCSSRRPKGRPGRVLRNRPNPTTCLRLSATVPQISSSSIDTRVTEVSPRPGDRPTLAGLDPTDPTRDRRARTSPTPPADARSSARPAPHARFTVEGRAAPGLFVLGWLAFIMGGAASFVACPRRRSAGPAAARARPARWPGCCSRCGLVAGAARRPSSAGTGDAPAATRGPSPFLVFAASIPVSILAVIIVAALAGGPRRSTRRAPAATLISVVDPGARLLSGSSGSSSSGPARWRWRDMGIGGRPDRGTARAATSRAGRRSWRYPGHRDHGGRRGRVLVARPGRSARQPAPAERRRRSDSRSTSSPRRSWRRSAEETLLPRLHHDGLVARPGVRCGPPSLRAAIFFAAGPRPRPSVAAHFDRAPSVAGNRRRSTTRDSRSAIALGWLFVERRSLAAPIGAARHVQRPARPRAPGLSRPADPTAKLPGAAAAPRPHRPGECPVSAHR